MRCRGDNIIDDVLGLATADKEHWEPTLQGLFYRDGVRTCLREAWSVDWHDHGDSAVLNFEVLNEMEQGVCECFIQDSRHKFCPPIHQLSIAVNYYGEAIAFLVKTFLSSHRVVCVGHSAGASAM